MTLFNRYILKQVILTTLLVALVLMTLQSFVELIAGVDATIRPHRLWGVLGMVALRLPSDLYPLFPIASFLGSLIGLAGLVHSHQLMAMSALGFSQMQIIRAVWLAAVLMAALMTGIGEGVTPYLDAQARRFESPHLNNVWLKEGNSFIHMGAIVSPQEIQNVTRFEVDREWQLVSIAKADHGAYIHHQWILYDVHLSLLGSDRIQVAHLDKMPLGIVFNPRLWQEGRKAIQRQSLFTLRRLAQYRQQAALSSASYEFEFWQRIFQPFLTMIMVGLSTPFILGSLRALSLGTRIISGLVLGLLLYALNQGLGLLAILYAISPMYAALTPIVLFGLLYVILLSFSQPSLANRSFYRA